ncbi:acetoin dehydrogenase dihydrolipoyllysine-residue acetyltransferase subunit [soil metagenome]
MPTIVKMPKWGLTMTAGTVVDWISAEGSEVSEGEPLLIVETEKAVDDVPAPADGILYRIVAGSGSEVPVSAPVAVILAPGESLSEDELTALVSAASPAAAAPAGSGSGSKAPREARSASRDRSGRVNASPAARKLAAELGVDLADVDATGPGGRITSDDVERAASGADDAGPEERDIPIANDRHIHALIAGPHTAQPILFLHGLGGSLGSWQIVLGGLAGQYRVVALDLPGHGASAKTEPSQADYSITGHAYAIGESLDLLGLKDTILVGHSLGGAVALSLASMQPGLVRGLVLIDSAALGTEISSGLLDLMAGEPGPETARELLDLFMEDKKLVTHRAIDEMAGNQLSEGGWQAQQATANAAFAGGKQSDYSAERLEQMTTPVLLIWGELDRVIPAAHGASAVSALPDAVLAVLPGVGHVPQVEQPDTVTRYIDRFARSLG